MPARRPVFLERQGYRRRRVMDAARMLPFLGLFLYGLPVLWARPAEQARDMATTGIYLFAVWLALILAAGGLARILAEETAGGAAGRGTGPGGAEPGRD